MPPSVTSIGERALVERLRERLGPPPPHVLLGVGDDAAILAPERGCDDVVTTDGLVEGVHFRRDWTPARAVGHKVLAINLSDLASMGATPRASLLTLAMPADFPLQDFDDLVGAYLELAGRSGATLVGGNMTRSPGPLVIESTVIGSVRRRRVLRRQGARAGDELYVTGELGAAAAGLDIAGSGLDRTALDTAAAACLARYERPDARTRCGRIVGRSRAASAAIDLSDGLADAATRLADAGGVGVLVDAAALPVHPGAEAWARRTGRDPVDVAVTGGEDYELAFAVSRRLRSRFLTAARRCRDLPMTRIGRFVEEPGGWLEREGTKVPLPTGFSHF